MLIRNALFNWGVLSSKSYPIPVISVGNIRVGGTGKTPMVEYLIRNFQNQYKIAVVSRGYGRSTKGCYTLDINSSAKQYGDEPVQIKRKFPETVVVVSEQRVVGIDRVLEDYPDVNLVLLDDAFQHRSVKPHIHVLLTTWSNSFLDDLPFPAGRLREFKSAYRRADHIVVTKSPKGLDREDFNGLQKIKDRPVYLSHVNYDKLELDKIYGFSGLANNKPFKKYLKENFDLQGFCSYSDHHDYTRTELQELLEKAGQTPLVCTEKDLVKVKDIDSSFPVEAVTISFEVVPEFIEVIRKKLNAFES